MWQAVLRVVPVRLSVCLIVYLVQAFNLKTIQGVQNNQIWCERCPGHQ